MTRSLLPLLMLTACGPKKDVAPAPPPVGWHAEVGWKGQCYFPPDFDELESTGGISARNNAAFGPQPQGYGLANRLAD